MEKKCKFMEDHKHKINWEGGNQGKRVKCNIIIKKKNVDQRDHFFIYG